MNCDNALTVTDIGPFVMAVSGWEGGCVEYNQNFPNCQCVRGDMNDDGAVTVGDIGLFVNSLTSPTGPLRFLPQRLWVEALTKDTSVGATSISAFVDLTGDTDFNDAGELDTVSATAFALSISPTTGGLGTPITLTIDPAAAPLQFGLTTTATWTGRFLPNPGVPTPDFSFAYSAAQFRESSPTLGSIVLGDGTGSNIPPMAATSSSGTLQGQLQIGLNAGLSMQRTTTLQLVATSAKWEWVSYPADGLGPPTLDGEPPQLMICMLSKTPNPNSPAESLLLLLRAVHS